MKIGFDNDKYLSMQSEHIKERIGQFGDKLYLEFGAHFAKEFLGQGPNEDRTIDQSLDLGWRLLSILPREELDRVDEAVLEQHYRKH